MKRVKMSLSKAFANDKVAHAYIFEGKNGTGVKETAFWMTKRFLCTSLQRNEACGECSECKRVDSLNHPDVHFIEPDGQSIKIDQIRSLQREFAYKGVETDKKVYIIQDVDKMTVQAANCLLKFLEEPNGKTLAILLTEEKNRLLSTILSRCQLYTFSALNEKDLVQTYVTYGVSEEQALFLSKLTSNVEQGLALLEEGWLEDARGLLEQFLQGYLKDPYSALVDLQSVWTEVFSDKEKQQLGLDVLLLAFKDMSQLSVNRSLTLPFLEEVYRRWLAKFSFISILEIMDAILQAKRQLRSNSSFNMVVESLYNQILSLEI
ncbi:DNA polymerase III subunit delta' [Peribacillus asahii]|uniref:DNA polymerase III subunit delta' n=1 Tax=Peribacillus asahii TaxID=228899 RepID=UPI00207A54D7|nr:DNA polymerase III subunit delta' [Peribacillus asahii]USK62226.1 DNA polymerase III subunit delta' [Peribacillus asahii]